MAKKYSRKKPTKLYKKRVPKKSSEPPTSTTLTLDSRKVIVDTREQMPYPFSEDFVVAKLDTGDYSIEGLEKVFVCERKKSVSEIAANFITDRWIKELDRLSKIPHAFLLLEFSFDDILRYPIGSDIPRSRWKYIKVKPEFIIACISSISIKYGVQVIYAGDRSNGQTILNSLIRRIRKMYPVEVKEEQPGV